MRRSRTGCPSTRRRSATRTSASHLHDTDAVSAWSALLLGAVPLAALASWLEGRIAVGVGERLKRRLLNGAPHAGP